MSEINLKYYEFDYPDHPVIVIVNDFDTYDTIMTIGAKTVHIPDIMPVEITRDEALLKFLIAAQQTSSNVMKLGDAFELFDTAKARTVFTFNESGVKRYEYEL